jgi:hypothetical protein
MREQNQIILKELNSIFIVEFGDLVVVFAAEALAC